MNTRWLLVGLWGAGLLLSGAVGSSFASQMQYQGGPVAQEGSAPELFLVVEALRLQYQGATIVEKGSVSGVVKAAGKPPLPRPIDVTQDQDVCGKSHPAESLVLGSDNEVKNAVVRLANIVKGKRLDTKTKVVLDQVKCQFVPHVVIVPVGATLEIKNSDPITHSVHMFSIENDPINKKQAKGAPVVTTRFTLPEIFKIQCDIHKWMNAWIVAADHPYNVVTDEKGQYKLADVPPAPGAGFYELEVWHETLGKVTKEITVKKDADTSVALELKKK